MPQPGLWPLAALLVALAQAPQPVPPRAAAPVLTGAYTCRGEVDAPPYVRVVVIAADGATLRFAWSTAVDSEPLTVGLGVRDGEVVAVVFLHRRTGQVGVALYRVTPDRLTAQWSMGQGRVSEEQCVRRGRAAA